jgi:Tol biopolymer transport system component
LQTDHSIYHSLGFSPDGRYLVVTGLAREMTARSDPAAILFLHDIARNETTPFLTRQPTFIASQSYDWSADGRWLSFALDDNLVAMVAPDEGYVRPLLHGYGACTSVAWLNE